MGRKMQDKHSGSYWDSHHPECSWSLSHIIKQHPWRHFVKRLAYMRGGGERSAAGTVPSGRHDAFSDDQKKEQNLAETRNSNVEEKVTLSSSGAKNSVRRQIKALIIKEISKKRSRHHRRSTCPIFSQSIHTTSTHDLEQSTIDPVAETVVTDGSIMVSPPDASKIPLATYTLARMPLVFCEESSTSTKQCVECGATPSGDYWMYNLVCKHQPKQKDLLLQEIKDEKQCIVDDKLIHSRKHTSGASSHVYKHFVDALDIINMNKDLLLTLLQDPVSHLVYHFHKQQVSSAKMILTRSASFPLPGSSSKKGGSEATKSINKLAGNGSLPKGKGKLCYSNKTQKSVQFDSSEVFCKRAMSTVAKCRVDGIFNINEAIVVRDVNSSLGSVQGQNQKEIKHFKSLKQKIEHVIREGRKEKLRVTMDAVIHKLPQGHGISDDLKKEIFNKLTDPTITREGADCPASFNERDLSTHSFAKHHQHRLRRISSHQEPLESYCQLYESSFNTEAKRPQSEQLKLRIEEEHSPLRMLKPFQRILSLPDLQSFSYAYKNEWFSDVLSSTTPTMASGDGIMSSESIAYQQKRLDLNADSKCQLQLDTPVKSLIKENLISVGENDLVTSNVVESGSDSSGEINGKVSIINDDFGHTILKNSGTFNDQDIGPIKEPEAAVAASVYSFTDADWMIVDSKSKPGPPDRLDNVAEEQEASMNSLKVAETTENAQKVEILSEQLNYEIPHFHVDTRDKAEFNYMRYVLEISGLTGNECHSAWHSSDQPVDPLLYEEMEGDPDFCSYEGGHCNHHLLFDLINEALLEIYGRSYSYCPKRLSSHSHIRPMPVGCHTLHEVWTRMSQSLCLRSKAGQTIDDHVSRDLSKHDGLVNLQLYAEFVGLELEDLIFHDLLEEIMWDLAYF